MKDKELFPLPPIKFTPDEIKAMKKFIKKIKKTNLFETNEHSPEAMQASNS